MPATWTGVEVHRGLLNGKLAGATGDLYLVASGRSFKAGALELDLTAKGVEALLVEGQSGGTPFHFQPRLGPGGAAHSHFARAPRQAYRDRPRRLREREGE